MAFLLCSRLVECAKAIEGDNLDVVDSLLAEIQSLTKEATFPTRKVVQYCAEALVRRVYGIRPPCPSPLQPPRYCYDHVPDPFYHFADVTTKHAISDALSSGNKRLHIVHFSILLDPYRWNYIIKYLNHQHGGLQSIRFTSIIPKLSNRYDHLRLKDELFIEYAEQLKGVKLEGKQLICNSPGDFVKCISKLRRKRNDERVVVIWDFILHQLLALDGAIEQVLSKLKDLEVDIMLILEQEANLNSQDFSHRLQQSFQYYYNVFEFMEKCSDGVFDFDNVLWMRYFRRQIGNVVACEGIDRIERIESFVQWQHHLSQAGFCPVPQQSDDLKKKFDLDDIGIQEKDGHMLLCWKSYPLVATSVWKCTDPPPFSGGLHIKQDTDDESEMASSSEDEADEANDLIVMTERNLWSTQGSSMNRMAASTKLFDILEDICHLHELPLAVTWISYGRDGNTNSRRKRILCIDESACYVNDVWAKRILRGYAHHRLKKGQGIAGKALQSNIHIQFDIAKLDKADCPYVAETSMSFRIDAAFATRLPRTHSCKDDYVLEFVLPESMEDTSERELLIHKVLFTLWKKCLSSWINPTSNQAEETHEPHEQEVREHIAMVNNKRRMISSVWDRFVKKNRAESKRGTSNLHINLESCSPSRQEDAEQQSLNLVDAGDLGTSNIQRNLVINQERSRLDIATMMIKHGYPLDMVQGETSQPVFKLYSQDVVEADVLAICRQEKEKLIKFFDNLSCLLSLTIALWSSNDKMVTYCCLTLHFIDDGWELKKKILAFRSLKYNCDMGTVHEVFKSVLTEWSINKNVRFIFFDINPPNDHMIGELRSKVSDQVPLIHEHQFCVSSYSQILSLLVQDGFSEIRSVLYKIRECIEYVNGSPLTRQKFHEAINNVRLQDNEMTTLDVPTRWETTFLMLESSLEFRRAFNHLEQLDGDFKVNPSAEEWNKATGICECLKELHKSTCNFPTSVEDYFLNVRDVYKNLLEWKQSEHVYVRSMANEMKRKFDQYWGEASLALGISIVLNPCFKLDLVEYGYQQIYGKGACLHFPNFRCNLTIIYHKYANDISNQGPSSSSIANVSHHTSCNLSYDEWSKSKVHSPLNELDQYLEQPRENLDKNCHILAWWESNAQNFPVLKKMARDFLTIPISTIISKSSLTKEVMKMASVLEGGDPEIVEALICGKDW